MNECRPGFIDQKRNASPLFQAFDRGILQAQSRAYGEEFLLREFYFEEANSAHICNLCHKFALDEA